MSGEFQYPHEAAFMHAISLANEDEVNGLVYNSGSVEISDDVIKSMGMSADEVASQTMLYYPAGILTSAPFLIGVQLHPGGVPPDGVIEEVFSNKHDGPILQRFIKSPAVQPVVDFTRSAHNERVSLVEKRNQLLWDYQAPLAAVSINLFQGSGIATLATPYCVWPWGAFAEMREYLHGED